MDVFGGNHSDSKTMTGDLVNDLEHPNNKNDSDSDAEPTVRGNKSVNHIYTKDDDNDDDHTNRSYHSNDDCFLDNEEELFFPLIKCESQSLLESMAKELLSWCSIRSTSGRVI